jgi:aminoglycoside phosphotransferase (APT) family kinase protein
MRDQSQGFAPKKMIAGRWNQARWSKPEPRRGLAEAELEIVLRVASLPTRVRHIEPLADGLRNANFKIDLGGSREPVVVRLYEHDPSLCQKEIDLIGLVGGAVPVPEIVHAEPSGWADLPPFAIFRFVEGISFRELKRGGDREAIAQAAFSAGETLAQIGKFEFAEAGWLGPGLQVVCGPPLEPDPIPAFVDSCLATGNAERRMDPFLRQRAQAMFWRWAPQLRALSAEKRLVHGDFGKRNLLMRAIDGNWTVAAVLDWEFACCGSPLADVGEFLRYESATSSAVEANFSDGFASTGGKLSADWRQLAKLVDTAKLCDSLTRDYLPEKLVQS